MYHGGTESSGADGIIITLHPQLTSPQWEKEVVLKKILPVSFSLATTSEADSLNLKFTFC